MSSVSGSKIKHNTYEGATTTANNDKVRREIRGAIR